MSNNDSSGLKIAVKTVIMIIFFMALIFVPAGTFKWLEAWIFLLLYFSWLTAIIIWLKKNDPELLKERMTARKKKDVKRWDKVFVASYSLVFVVFIVLIGLDAVRFRWSYVPLIVKVIGFLGFIPAMSIGTWAMKENTYLSEKMAHELH